MKPIFTEAELEVMQVLWTHGELKPGEIEAHFPREVGNGAVRSVLLILLEKGHVEREKDGRAYRYRAATPPESEFRSMTRRLMELFCGGSPKALIAQLIKEEKLNEEDLKELQALAAGQLKKPRKGGDK
jgi:predicted transcriptional regulator